MNTIKKHKNVLIVTIICLVLIFLAVFAVYKMFNPNSNKNIYGPNSKNAPTIDNAVVERAKEEVLALGTSNTITYQLSQSGIMKFFIDVKGNTTVEKAKEIADIVVQNFSNTITSYYDMEFYFTQKEGEDKNYPMIAYHSKSENSFRYVMNKEIQGEPNEE